MTQILTAFAYEKKPTNKSKGLIKVLCGECGKYGWISCSNVRKIDKETVVFELVGW